MADSMGQSFKASDFGVKGKKKRNGKQEGDDTPQARENRLALYAARAAQGKESGRPVNIFTGIEYTPEELEVVEVENGNYEE